MCFQQKASLFPGLLSTLWPEILQRLRSPGTTATMELPPARALAPSHPCQSPSGGAQQGKAIRAPGECNYFETKTADEVAGMILMRSMLSMRMSLLIIMGAARRLLLLLLLRLRRRIL